MMLETTKRDVQRPIFCRMEFYELGIDAHNSALQLYRFPEDNEFINT
jgi:hypothetical protein